MSWGELYGATVPVMAHPVKYIAATERAFCVLYDLPAESMDASVVPWGSADYGGVMPIGFNTSQVVAIAANSYTFAYCNFSPMQRVTTYRAGLETISSTRSTVACPLMAYKV